MNLNFNILDAINTVPTHTYKIFEEYLLQIDKYKNISFTALPVRFIVPDENNSIYDELTDTTYKKNRMNKTGLKYKVYEYVPVFYSSPIMYSLMVDPEFGAKFDAGLNISVIGFKDITVGSYVQFYGDYLSKIVFEVSNIRTPLTTNLAVPIYELDLIRAPSDLDIDVSEIYFYDYSEEKFIPINEFKNKIQKLEYLVNEIIPKLNSQCFDNRKEIFLQDTNNKDFNKYVCTTIADKFNRNYRRLPINIPFGYCFENEEELNLLSEENYPRAKDLVDKFDCVNAAPNSCRYYYCEFLKTISEIYKDEY